MLQLLVRNWQHLEKLLAIDKNSLPHTETWYDQQHPSIMSVNQKWRKSSALLQLKLTGSHPHCCERAPSRSAHSISTLHLAYNSSGLYMVPEEAVTVALLGLVWFFSVQVLKFMRKLCCTTPESEHDANGTCTEVGQVRAYKSASTAGAELKHSQGWHSSHLHCPEQILNTLHLLCLGLLLKGTTSKGSAGAKLSHQVSKRGVKPSWHHGDTVALSTLLS